MDKPYLPIRNNQKLQTDLQRNSHLDNSLNRSNSNDRSFSNLSQSVVSNRKRQFTGQEKVDVIVCIHLKSDFSVISGSASTFSRAERNVYKSPKSSPGPGDYNVSHSKHKPNSPNHSFSKSPKRGWIDEEVKKRDNSPGPIYSPKHGVASKGLKKR